MLKRSLLLIAATLLAVAPVSASSQGPVPTQLKKLRPVQVVEQVMAQRQTLALTDSQFAALDDLAQAIRTEKHTFTHRGGKPHQTRHVPMVDQQEAWEDALAILTPEQQVRLTGLYPATAPAERPAPRRIRSALPGKP